MTVHSDASATPTGASLELMQVRQLNLLEGMPLTTEDLPGLEPQGSDGVVALVSRRPADPKALLLRNRSKQTWVVTDQGGERTVNPGQSAELSARCQINFGQAKGTLDLGQGRQLDGVRERALASGAVRAHVIDAREDFARDVVLPALQAGVMSAAQRPVSAHHLPSGPGPKPWIMLPCSGQVNRPRPRRLISVSETSADLGSMAPPGGSGGGGGGGE